VAAAVVVVVVAVEQVQQVGDFLPQAEVSG
jgi:ABC-type methionine transport system permease subunit